MPDNQESKKLLTDMRMQVSYSDVATMPIPLYERIKAALGVQESPSKELEQKGDLNDKWECFSDPSYFDMWAVRHTSNKSFTAAIHINTPEEAEFLTDKLNKLDSLVMENAILRGTVGCKEMGLSSYQSTLQEKAQQLTATQQALDSALQDLEFYKLCNSECFTPTQEEFIEGLVGRISKKGQRPYMKPFLERAYLKGREVGMLQNKAALDTAVEALKSVDELWDGDEGYRKEQRACEQLKWDSPVFLVWKRIKAALASIKE